MNEDNGARLISDSMENAFETRNFLPRDFPNGVNLTEAVMILAKAGDKIAHAVLPPNALPCRCPTGDGNVGSMVEVGVSISAALCKVAYAIGDLAEAVRETKEND